MEAQGPLVPRETLREVRTPFFQIRIDVQCLSTVSKARIPTHGTCSTSPLMQDESYLACPAAATEQRDEAIQRGPSQIRMA
jgi:hypothetical protein